MFAPTDEAFAKLPKGTVEDPLKPENKAKLTAILTYHVVPGAVKSAQAMTLSSAKTVNGKGADAQRLTVGALHVDSAKGGDRRHRSQQRRDSRHRHGRHSAVERTMRRILLTGATGYVGGRLLRVLESRGLAVRCLARNPAYLSARVAPETEVVTGDVLDESSLDRALQGIDTAYYLVHAWAIRAASKPAKPRAPALVLRRSAPASAGSSTSVVWATSARTSPHLRSRHEVGRILRGCGVPTPSNCGRRSSSDRAACRSR